MRRPAAGRGFPDLIDPLREVHVPSAWPDADAFLQQAPARFCLDRTAGQATAVYVACEKDILRAQFTGWLEKTGVPVLVVRGFGSQGYVQVVKERTARDRRPAVLLYVEDFDASGADIERDWVARTACWASVERVLLTHEQVREHQLPPAVGKVVIPAGRRSPADTGSTRPVLCSGRSKHSIRPSSSAWSPSPRTSTTRSSTPASPTRRASARGCARSSTRRAAG
ncbi:hypothetical protein RND61_03010 [Streptomyces sp. TRM76323]|uniref:Uncharacterized protein n=1 Tax=Streptomyces tamarix TaxID=3078565 RepID=A0ABU3QF99_9ACTN|nr:hypothetical protein [Streptomyces tamarix]MDT9681052.1 hypothetical protein [Streptomyces tamarix]